MNLKINSITVHSVDYKDSDRILTLFSLEKGKLSATCRGVRKANAKLKNLAEPFCFAEVVLAEKSGRYTVTEANVFDGFYPLRVDIVRCYAAFSALEFTSAFMPEGLESPAYFQMLVKFLKELSYGSYDPKDLLSIFLYTALSESGYSLNARACARCGEDIEGRVFFSKSEGASVCENCKQSGDREYMIDTFLHLKELVELSEGVGGNLKTTPDNKLGKAEDGAKEEKFKGESGQIDVRVNTLKFLSHYITSLTGVTLKSLTTLVNL